MRAASSNAEQELSIAAPDREYRIAFLNLSRNQAPTGKSFDRIDISDAAVPERRVSLETTSRQGINSAIRALKPKHLNEPEPATIDGILRAVHLDQDWLEVTLLGEELRHVRIEDAGEVLDDVIGPMVNRRVTVSAAHVGNKFFYRDIDLHE